MTSDLFTAYNVFELWQPVWAAVVVFCGIFYMISLKYTPNHGISTNKKVSVLFSLFLVYAVIGSPFHVIASHYLISAYLLQLSLLYLVVPEALILGIPKNWIEPLLARRFWKKILRVLTFPWVTAILFNAGLSVYLVPTVFHPIHIHPVYDAMARAVLFIMAVLQWWSILSPVRELNPLTELQRVFYIFITAVMLMPIAVYMIFAGNALYPSYAATSQVFGFMTSVYDQGIGAGILKIFQLTAFGITLAVMVYRWMKRERAEENPAEIIPFPKKDNTQ